MTEGKFKKGGINRTYQITERPADPPPMRPATNDHAAEVERLQVALGKERDALRTAEANAARLGGSSLEEHHRARRAEAEAESLRSLLREVEICPVDGTCHVCGKGHPHKPDCRLAAALRKADSR